MSQHRYAVIHSLQVFNTFGIRDISTQHYVAFNENTIIKIVDLPANYMYVSMTCLSSPVSIEGYCNQVYSRYLRLSCQWLSCFYILNYLGTLVHGSFAHIVIYFISRSIATLWQNVLWTKARTWIFDPQICKQYALILLSH